MSGLLDRRQLEDAEHGDSLCTSCRKAMQYILVISDKLHRSNQISCHFVKPLRLFMHSSGQVAQKSNFGDAST